MRGIEEIALAFDAACRDAGVGYAFIGAMAVMAWGEPRATQDVDALVEISADKIEPLQSALRARGLSVDPRDLLDAMGDGSHVTVSALDSIFYVDAKLARSPIERRQVAEAGEVPFGSALLRVVRPEETIAFKLSFGTPKDIQDARSILVRAEGGLDRARLLAFALQLGVRDALRQVEEDLRKLQ